MDAPESGTGASAAVEGWSADEVAEWVATTVGLPQYRETFLGNDIAGDVLSSLLEGNVLKEELGIASFGHRTRILKSIRELLGLMPAASPSVRSLSSQLSSTSLSSQEPPGEGSSSSSSLSSGSSGSIPARGSISSSSSSSSSSSLQVPASPSTSRSRSSSFNSGDASGPSSDGIDEGNVLDQSLRIEYKELKLGRVLGKGFFGEVRQGTWRGSDVAVKVIYRREFRNSDQLQLFEKEIRVLSLLRHPNIVQFLGVCTDTEKCIVSELMGGGSIEDLVLSQFHVLEANAYLRPRIILNVARGMCYLHERVPPILHRDLTPKNILLDRHYTAKVADFGLSKVGLDEKMTSAVGYLPFQAPEVFTGSDYTEKADIYSFGMVVWFLFSGVHPEKDAGTPLKMAHMVAYKQYRPSMPDRIPPYWRTLIQQCWDQVPSNRPTFAQIISFIQDYKQRFGGDEKGYLMDTLPRSNLRQDSDPLGIHFEYKDEFDDYDDVSETSGHSGGSGSGSSDNSETGIRLARDVGYSSFGKHSGGTSGEYIDESPKSPAPSSPEPSSVPSTAAATTQAVPPPPPSPPAKAEQPPSKKTRRVRCKKVRPGEEHRTRKTRKGMTDRRIIIGNKCKSSGLNGVPYEWTVYVRGNNDEDISPFLKHVMFVLHPTFFPNKITVREAPYQVMRRGWGTFEVGVVLTFKDEQVLSLKHQLDFNMNHPTERTYDISFDTTNLHM